MKTLVPVVTVSAKMMKFCFNMCMTMCGQMCSATFSIVGVQACKLSPVATSCQTPPLKDKKVK